MEDFNLPSRRRFWWLLLPSLLVFLLSEISLRAQDFYDWNKIPIIKLTFDRPDWAEILSQMKDKDSEMRMSANLEIDGVKYTDVGVRFKGNSSFKSVKKSASQKLPFNIKVNYKYKDQKLPGGYETIKLSNFFRDPSFVREQLSYEIARQYMPASQCNFARLYVNGNYYGIYSNAESVDEVFLKKHFGNDNGTFVKCDPEWTAPKSTVQCPEGDKSSLMYIGDNPACYFADYEMKSDSGWTEFISLTKMLNSRPEKIHEILDVDQVLWMHAFNNVLVNLDSYTGRLSHNYYLYFDKGDGLFHPIVWDFNLSFGGFRYDGAGPSSMTNADLCTMSPFVHFKNKNPKRPLIVNLLNNPLYRKIYVAHLRTILEEQFVSGYTLQRAKALRAWLDAEVKADTLKLYTYEDFRSNLEKSVTVDATEIIGLEELVKGRTEYLTNHPLLLLPAPKIDTVEHFKFGNTTAIQATVQGAQKVWLYYRHEPKARFQVAEMYDDSSHNDVQAADYIWGATLEFRPGTEYYVVAESENAASTFPARASFLVLRIPADKD